MAFSLFHIAINQEAGQHVYSGMEHLISGIQQCGIGTKDAHEAALFYKNLLGMKCLLFDDIADASLMRRYTGNEVHPRRAMLTMNLQGGGGLELWQFLNREPQPNPIATRFGDLGIYAIKIKTANVAAAHQFFLPGKIVPFLQSYPIPLGKIIFG